MTNKLVLVAMSGGVDSSTAAVLLREQGYETVGVTMDTGYGSPVQQAAAVCAELGILHYTIDVRERFREEIVRGFAEAYLAGETPNPCISCNAAFKFPAFFPLMEQLGAEHFATGHYVRTAMQNGRVLLRCGVDARKDQSYFLYRLPQSVLRKCLFPLGGLSKDEVRELAERYQLPSAHQKDSYDICFVPQDYRELLRDYAADRLVPGDIVDVEGRIVGRHSGLGNYTVGQRRGVEVALGYPAYVVRQDAASNRLVVGPRELLFGDSFAMHCCNWLLFDQPQCEFEAMVRIRYQAAPIPANIIPTGQGRAEVRLSEKVWGLTAGQSAVCYLDDLLIGGGVIAPAERI